ncbi:MAG: PilZ domain-containing protein [Deltaproteobacteria bacterium]|nr:PilZ domain-containing protein [Deltaproteobacteria bacterium]MBW1875414.1 PilZ domain-containing protein [Deltaproteobacteria bacterium]MBW2211657.1 PilZ domain-containing protein [Deltaproteobacteria bacterium]MBW2214384.1 PilZ domain-containing protein [Deltaproteobacteria bacterium]MBW2380037.1 PilZ domain-containing protein [Deltaproteobacteria bacterium]
MLFGAHRETLVPVALYAELVADDEVMPAFVTSISEHGLLLDSLAILGNRRSDRLQIQLTLPGEPDPLWIGAEVVRDTHGSLFNDTAIRFMAMANAHWHCVRRWVRVRELVLTTRPVGVHHAA